LRQNTGNFGLQSRRRVRCRAGPSAFYKLRDDRIVPVICPTCQNVFAGSLKPSIPATPCYFAWGCFRHFSLGRAPRSSKREKPRLAAGPSLLSLSSGSN
jgi:hypothetical protein